MWSLTFCKGFFLLFYFLSVRLCMWVQVPAETRRGCEILRICICNWWMRVLGTKLGSSVRVARALSYWVVSSIRYCFAFGGVYKIFFFCVRMFCLHVCVPLARSVCGRRKRVSDPLELELQMLVSRELENRSLGKRACALNLQYPSLLFLSKQKGEAHGICLSRTVCIYTFQMFRLFLIWRLAKNE